MKRNIALLTVLLSAGLLLQRCAKEVPPEVLKTRLVITLRDEKGESVEGTIVTLYKKNQATPVSVKTADTTGILLYPDLEPTTYTWLAKKGCKTNLASQTTLGRPLLEGAALYGYSVMANTSTLQLKNTDTTIYTLSYTGVSLSLPGDTAFTTYPKVGSQKLTLKRKYMPSFSKDSTILFKCDSTIRLNIPF